MRKDKRRRRPALAEREVRLTSTLAGRAVRDAVRRSAPSPLAMAQLLPRAARGLIDAAVPAFLPAAASARAVASLAEPDDATTAALPRES